jgi:tetratricopeptide (TPR) repeat protein
VDAAAAAIGTKERIKQLLNVKEHMQKAIQFNPTDPTSYYLLGEWHFSCYNVSWAERQIAKVIFGTLPEPDLDEALGMFKKAEQIEPGFYSRNLLLMAKTLNALKREPEVAKQSLRTLLEKYESSTKWDDTEVRASSLLP